MGKRITARGIQFREELSPYFNRLIYRIVKEIPVDSYADNYMIKTKAGLQEEVKQLEKRVYGTFEDIWEAIREERPLSNKEIQDLRSDNEYNELNKEAFKAKYREQKSLNETLRRKNKWLHTKNMEFAKSIDDLNIRGRGKAYGEGLGDALDKSISTCNLLARQVDKLSSRLEAINQPPETISGP